MLTFEQAQFRFYFDAAKGWAQAGIESGGGDRGWYRRKARDLMALALVWREEAIRKSAATEPTP